ncbi:hypothetical protein [Marinifilum flexuosum]|uniref:Transposase n=1 Tax=Marinifilum flexuosum TaxID=1117708 RepID=A0A419X9P4_9BACT|nr:hypothetical protein [Marinifilum flexuosum]RKE04452.1 hypothetical protein BXY64_1472 [Marinifilum flexuosum]
MPTSKEKKKFSKKEKAELLESFAVPLNDKSLRIIEYFQNSGKDLNKLLANAYKYRHLC